MVSAVLFFISSTIVGLAILELFQIYQASWLKNILGLTIGLVLNILVIFLASLFFGLNLITAITFSAINFFPSLVYLITKDALPNILDGLDLKKNWLAIFDLTLISFLIFIIFIKSIFVDANGIIAG